ncbi:MAG: phosphoserine phosphatase SerB [Acidimicrobiales bacterium]|nr:phosphoserine phosphatase SerB [Acidimicrobiales bacterium]
MAQRSSPSSAHEQTILVTISGIDRTGITAGVMDVIGSAGADVEDVEQTITRGRLSLSIVVVVPPGRDLVKELLLFGWEQQMDVDFEVVDSTPTPRAQGQIVTLVGREIHPLEFAAVAAMCARAGANIDRITRIARYPVMAYELVVRGGHAEELRRNLLLAGRDLRCDLAVVPEGLGQRATRLIIMDVDSTLIQNEMIDILASEAGHEAEVSAITSRAMAGELDFTESLIERAKFLEGLDEGVFMRARAQIKLTPGAATFIRTLNALGYRTAIVSGGFTAIADSLADDLGIDYAFANTLEVVEGRLTGRVIGDIVDRQRKAELVHELAAKEDISVDQVVAIGDGANDLAMLNIAGLGIAFNAKQVVQDATDTALNVPYLDAILYFLGVRRDDIENAGLA